MAYRTLKPDLWQTPWFEGLSPSAKLLFLYLCTAPAGNVIGLFQISSQRMANDTGLPLTELPDALSSLTATDRVKVYDSGWVWVVKAAKHQVHGLSKGMRAHIASSILSCTCENARHDFLNLYKKLVKPWPRHGHAIPMASSVSSQGSVVSSQRSVVSSQVQKAKTPLSSPPGGLTEAFVKFWTAYPRKIGKGSALKAWLKLHPTPIQTATILAKVAEAMRSEQWTRDGGQFIPYPATWLNRQGWEDDYTTPMPEVRYGRPRVQEEASA